MPDQSRELDVKNFIQKAAEEGGMESAKAIAFAEKCYGDMPLMWQPYGGATSFDDIDTQRTADFYNSRVQSETSALEGIIHNITQSEDLSADEKATKIAAAADDYRSRIATLDEKKPNPYDEKSGIKALTSKFLTGLKNVIVGAPREEKGITTGFRMIEDNEGNLRWISFSSNAFEDKYKQLFSTKALEEAVEYADKTGERGPLLLFHQWPARIGTADFQAVSGRFLVESGTFDDTLYGRKAVEYFLEHQDEPFEVSIGFAYKDGDDVDGVYDWTRIRERSVLPQGKAANKWTDFRLAGDERMRTDAKAFLDGVLGSDEADKIVAEAATRTKSLEEQGIKHREAPEVVVMSDEDAGEITGVKELEAPAAQETPAAPEYITEAHSHGNVEHSHRMIPEQEHTHQNVKESFKAMKKADAENPKEEMAKGEESDAKTSKKEAPEGGVDVKALAVGVANMMDMLTGIKESLDTIPQLQEDIKSLKASDEERLASIMTPRWNVPGGIRPTEEGKNVITDPNAIKAITEGDTGKDGETVKQPVNPAAIYVEDLIPSLGRPQQG